MTAIDTLSLSPPNTPYEKGKGGDVKKQGEGC